MLTISIWFIDVLYVKVLAGGPIKGACPFPALVYNMLSQTFWPIFHMYRFIFSAIWASEIVTHISCIDSYWMLWAWEGNKQIRGMSPMQREFELPHIECIMPPYMAALYSKQWSTLTPLTWCVQWVHQSIACENIYCIRSLLAETMCQLEKQSCCYVYIKQWASFIESLSRCKTSYLTINNKEEFPPTVMSVFVSLSVFRSWISKKTDMCSRAHCWPLTAPPLLK